jgi:hypothetical protein
MERRREHGRGGPTRREAPRGALATRGQAVGSVLREAEGEGRAGRATTDDNDVEACTRGQCRRHGIQ